MGNDSQILYCLLTFFIAFKFISRKCMPSAKVRLFKRTCLFMCWSESPCILPLLNTESRHSVKGLDIGGGKLVSRWTRSDSMLRTYFCSEKDGWEQFGWSHILNHSKVCEAALQSMKSTGRPPTSINDNPQSRYHDWNSFLSLLSWGVCLNSWATKIK